MNPRDLEVHWTNLKRMASSPAHYLAAARGEHHKKVYAGGRLLHYLVLGGDYVVYDGKRQGNAWKSFAEENAGRDIFTRAEVDRETAVANAVKNHPIAAPLLVGEHEVEIKWEWMGRRCSSRLDVRNKPLRRAVDLKRSVTSEPERFRRSALGYGYHAQGAFYQDACEATQTPIDEYYVVAVEPAPPYAVTVFRMTSAALHQGRKLNRLWMERLLACEAANEFPEYAQTIIDLDSEEASDLIFGDDFAEAGDDEGGAEAAQ